MTDTTKQPMTDEERFRQWDDQCPASVHLGLGCGDRAALHSDACAKETFVGGVLYGINAERARVAEIAERVETLTGVHHVTARSECEGMRSAATNPKPGEVRDEHIESLSALKACLLADVAQLRARVAELTRELEQRQSIAYDPSRVAQLITALQSVKERADSMLKKYDRGACNYSDIPDFIYVIVHILDRALDGAKETK